MIDYLYTIVYAKDTTNSRKGELLDSVGTNKLSKAHTYYTKNGAQKHTDFLNNIHGVGIFEVKTIELKLI